MANKRRTSSSTGKRRQQGREPRQVQTKGRQNQGARRNTRKRTAPRRSPWLFVGGALVVIAAIVVLFVFLSRQSSSTPPGQVNTSANATTFKEVTNVDPGLLSKTGTGGIANPFQSVPGSPPLLAGPTGKPEVFFYGAEWCPNCAAERWSMVVALSRFGTFHTLKETTSSSSDTYPNTATFSFYQTDYTSSYIDFVPVETQDRQRNDLQTPTADQQQILTRYNVNGYPFMDIGDRYLITAASYDPGLLRTNPSDPSSQPLSQQDIASQLSTENTVSKSILGTANYLTAAICSITKKQPSNVCSSSSIQQIESSLAKTGQSNAVSGDLSFAAVAEPSALNVRRKQG